MAQRPTVTQISRKFESHAFTPIKGTAVRDIFTTFIQLMYKIFREMEDVMFPTRETLPFSTINSRIEEMVISAGDTVLDTSDQLLTFATLF